MGSSLFPLIPVKAQEEKEISDLSPEEVDINTNENESEKLSETSGEFVNDEVKEAPTENMLTDSDKGNLSKAAKDSATVYLDESDSELSPFKLQVTFDGKELNENTGNNISESWGDNSSKVMSVVVTRNTDVPVDNNKQYVLCMKTSEVFYFNGIPDANKITGAENVTIVKNAAPVVNKASGKSGSLDGFSDYSGEIRIKLNPTVETITIPDVGINYNNKLVGFNGVEQTVTNPLSVQLISTDSQSSLNEIDKKNVLHSMKVDTISVSSKKFGSTTWKSAMSTDYFNNAVLMQPITLGKKDGHVSYYFGTNGVEYQVYKSLKIKINCPYVEVNGEKHYLAFSLQDTSLSNNKKTYATGYTMSAPAEYNSADHTITYTFQNVYLGGHTPLLYTPDYTWPSELADSSITGEGYVIHGVSFEVIEQTGYLGNTSTLQSSFTQDSKYTATFIPEGINVKMASSYQSGNDVAKRFIYKGLSRENGNEGTLGFFDIHNEGTQESSLLDIKYQFNEPEASAKYYVTRVNLAVYGNESGTDVSYVLNNGTEQKSGKKHYSNKSSFACYVTDLRKDCGADNTYYIQSVSYQTCLQQGTNYHLETAHLKRNRISDSGLFFGYLEGELNTSANAVMTISAADKKTAITADEKTEISSTEISTVSDQDYIGMQISNVNIGGASSQMISAGNSVTLNVSGMVSTEEYPLPNDAKVNGYHVLRNGIFYVCLPEGVSIAGLEQIKISSDGKKVPPKEVKRIDKSFEVDGVQAYWWEIQVDGLNTEANQIVQASIELSTSEAMPGIVWNFSRHVGIRANGQRISWGAASDVTSVYNTLDDLAKSNNTEINNLKAYLQGKSEDNNLGIEILNQNGNVKLNIARAEAKLDVTTSLSTEESSDKSVSIADKNSEVTYSVNIACTEQGAAKNFNYYIPIVHRDSSLDTGALVSQNEIGMQLYKAVDIKRISAVSVNEEELPFEIYYTTDSNLTSSSIRADSVHWEKNPAEYSAVTAVRIATKTDASVKEKEEYQFSIIMKYDNSKNDFENQAGSIAAWRSFGHYTYTRNGATTTNSYPSSSNSVKIRYVKNLTDTPMTLNLDTAANENYIDTSQPLSTTFVKKQNLKIKAVTPSNGTQLISENWDNMTGADANGKFKISFNVNNSESAKTLPSIGAGWAIEANKDITLQARAFFSKALTDITTERYIDVVLGNEDIDIKCRIKLERKVAAASAEGSGIALGEQYQVPQVSDTCSISKDSAFTALYVVNNFIPGNYSSQLLKWEKSDGTESDFPSGTSITMLEIDEHSQVTSYWYCHPTSASVNLSEFKRMGGSENYSYDTDKTASTTLRYLFVVNFGQANADVGDFQMVFDANAKAGASTFDPVTLKVTLGNTKGYELAVSKSTDLQQTAVNVNYTVREAIGNDSYSEGKSLSLILTPKNLLALPKDAKIVCGEKEYTCNSKGNIIIPLGTIQSSQVQLVMTSEMFLDSAQTYQFDAKLYVSNSSHDESSSDGKMVASTTIDFEKDKIERPSLKITGTQIADIEGWSNGQNIDIIPKNLSGYELTATAYEGIDSNQKVTDLVSSVSGMFEMKDGIGLYKPENTSNGKLILSGTAKSGTYRLVFEVKDSSGKTLLQVPYYFIVQN